MTQQSLQDVYKRQRLYMATMKVKFRASSISTKEGTLFYQVVHGRVARQVNTGYKVYPCEWDRCV